MKDTREWRMLKTADDVTDDVLHDVESCVDWFDNEPTMGTEEFIDRLCKTYGGHGEDERDYDLDSYDNAAVRKIMREARRIRKERQA